MHCSPVKLKDYGRDKFHDDTIRYSMSATSYPQSKASRGSSERYYYCCYHTVHELLGHSLNKVEWFIHLELLGIEASVSGCERARQFGQGTASQAKPRRLANLDGSEASSMSAGREGTVGQIMLYVVKSGIAVVVRDDL